MNGKIRLLRTLLWGAVLLGGTGMIGNAQALPICKLLMADRVFDGYELKMNAAVLINGQKITAVATKSELADQCANVYDLGDATILPGFIESHAHVTFQNVRKDKIVQHGVTTVQDTGGPLLPPESGRGQLRLLSTGPILQAPGGYPLNIFGVPHAAAANAFTPLHGDAHDPYQQIGVELETEVDARITVQHIIANGGTAIKVSLEPGGETGAPWMQPHGSSPVPTTPWAILPLKLVKTIVDEAHHPQSGKQPRRVIAHVGENTGFARALNAGIDEFAHMPCAPINPSLLTKAANTQGLTFVSTIDTLSSCVDTHTHKGIHSNTAQLAAQIVQCEIATPGQCAQIIYGSEIGHDNVPWGINGEEMHMLLHLTSGAAIDFTDVLNVFKAVTSKAGARLGIDKLGTLAAGAPADVIAVRGNPFERFKLLEYPDMVIAGGGIVLNRFKH